MHRTTATGVAFSTPAPATNTRRYPTPQADQVAMPAAAGTPRQTPPTHPHQWHANTMPWMSPVLSALCPKGKWGSSFRNHISAGDVPLRFVVGHSSRELHNSVGTRPVKEARRAAHSHTSVCGEQPFSTARTVRHSCVLLWRWRGTSMSELTPSVTTGCVVGPTAAWRRSCRVPAAEVVTLCEDSHVQ